MRAFTSSRTRIALVSTAVIALALLVVDVAVVGTLAYAQREDSDALLALHAQSVLSSIEDRNGVLAIAGGGDESVDGIAVDTAIVSHGAVVAQTPEQPLTAAQLAALAARAAGGDVYADVADARGQPRRAYAQPAPNLGAGAVVVVSRSVSEPAGTLARTALALGAASAALVLVAGLVTFRMAGLTLRPVRDSYASLERFTADASHELRAPLALLRSEIDVALEHQRDPGEYRDSLAAMRDDVDHLARIADHLLVLARADANALHPTLEEVDVADTLHETAARWSHAAERAGVRLEVDAPENGTLRAEPALLRRVLDNLLDNALRHTPTSGTVRLGASRASRGWSLTVADTGPGIPAEHRARLFTPFARPDAARTRERGGAGLGLALSAAIARAHGGRLELVPGGPGAAFRLFLPD